MPLFNGPVAKIIRKHKLIKRTALLGGALGESYRKDWTEDQLKEYEEYLKGDQ